MKFLSTIISSQHKMKITVSLLILKLPDTVGPVTDRHHLKDSHVRGGAMS